MMVQEGRAAEEEEESSILRSHLGQTISSEIAMFSPFFQLNEFLEKLVITTFVFRIKRN